MAQTSSDVLIPGAKPVINTGLSFIAQSVTVDNYTPNPIIVNDDVAQAIPPFTYGVQRNFNGTQNAQARFDVAVGVPNTPSIPSVGQVARLTWTTDVLPATAGVSLLPLVVQVAGAVNIGSSGQVTILGTPTVNIAAGQNVGITGTVTVSITGTPNVTISGTPTVILGGGTASVGSISAIGSTVTVAGTVSISGTPSVTISGTPTVTITGTPTVNIGNTPSVTISGTPTVNINTGQSVGITGTVTVSISGTPSVSISGTPTVILGGGTASVGSISAIGSTVTVAGTVSIGNTPSVTISGTPTVNIAAAQTVGITGTVTVNIAGTSAVSSTVALNALFASARISTAGLSAFSCAFQAGTLVGTVRVVATNDGFVTSYYGGQFVDALGNVLGNTLANPSAASYGILAPTGATNVGIQVDPYTSGTVTATMTGTTGISPSILITGSPTVVLGGGSASVGSISAISSTVTVAGTISIGNTPSVTISGTPTVNIGNTPAVTISGTPTVTISSGSVSISGTASISIVAQSITVAVNQPQTSLGNFTMAPSASNNATYAIPAGTHAIGILISGPGATLLRVSGVTTGIDYLNLNWVAGMTGYFVSPVLSVLDTSVKVWSTASAVVGTVTVYSVAILTAEGVFIFDNAKEPIAAFLTDPFSGGFIGSAATIPLYVNTGTVQQPWERPDVSSGFSIGGLAINGTQSLRAAIGGQRVILFAWRLGTDAVANDAIISLQSTTGTNIYDNVSLQTSAHGYDSAFYGAPGELGAGVQMKNTGNIASGNLRGKFVSSQA